MSLSAILACGASMMAAETKTMGPAIENAYVVVAGDLLVDCRGTRGVRGRGWLGRLDGMSAVVAGLGRGDL